MTKDSIAQRSRKIESKLEDGKQSILKVFFSQLIDGKSICMEIWEMVSQSLSLRL